MKKQNKGITLIALVITIIILLILAGVSVVTLTGDNGLLTKSNEAVKENIKGEERDQLALAYQAVKLDKLANNDNTSITVKELNSALGNNGINLNDSNITKETDKSLIVEMPSGNKYKVTQTGVITEVQTGNVQEPQVSITEYVKVGDYVDYEPTKTDVSKTQAVEASKLTYTSPTGTIPTDSTGIITHGNGYTSTEEGGGQTFTAKANDGTINGLKWRVLSVSEDKVELISETAVKKDATDQNNGNFVLQGGIGYLYAEQELNEVCKIYGYGYGADTSVGATYTVGGPEDTPITETIEGTGARSITIEDLNKKAGIYKDELDGIMKYSDGTVIDTTYGTTTNLKTTVYYPTLRSTNTTYPGRSAVRKKGFKDTYYGWNKSKIMDDEIQSMLFDENYWLSSRCLYANSTVGNFYVYMINYGDVDARRVCYSNSSEWGNHEQDIYTVRPVVTLKSDVIDINTDYNAEREWKLK